MWKSKEEEAAPACDYLLILFRGEHVRRVQIPMDANDDDTFWIEDGFLVINHMNGNTIHFPVSDILQFEYSIKPFS